MAWMLLFAAPANADDLSCSTEENRMTTARSALSEPTSSASVSHVRRGEHAPVPSCPDDGLSDYLSVRPRLFGIAYGMLGSAVEAEDVVQDVWLRWQRARRRRTRSASPSWWPS